MEESDPSFQPAAVFGDASWSQAFLIRAFEERLLKLFSEGKLFGTVHTCIGQEFTGVALATHLQPGDAIFSNHRCHGHYLSRTGDVDGLMAEIMGRTTGICGGRGGSQHICAHDVYSNGVQGGIVPLAAGRALAQNLNGTGNIAVCFIGDGTLGEGALYEALNIASKWDLPLLVVLENNGYAQSTNQSETLAGGITQRAESFGIATWHGDTWHPEALFEQMSSAVRQVRTGRRPAFVQVDTYRLMAHSKGDDNRSTDEVKRSWDRDPLVRYAADHPEESARMRERAEIRVSRAVEAALEAPFSDNGHTASPAMSPPIWQSTGIEGKERVVARIYLALREQMERDHRTFLLGEDIEGPYGGAFKVTKDLSQLFPGRVRNTPISEAAVVGIANGLALAGMRPVCEIMFGDFLTLAADQIINHAAKFQWMYNGQVTVPAVIRTPMGGKRGYGSTHSQCLEKHFLGIPGTLVLAVHHRYDPRALYESLFSQLDCPALVIENKLLYGEYVTHRTIAGFWCEHSDERFPTTRIRSTAKPDITMVCYGGCLPDVEKALDRLFEEHEIVGEVICPTQIYPLQIAPILESVARSGRLLVIEEGQGFCGFGAEVLAALYENPPARPVAAGRMSAAPHPLPCCKPAELECLPGVDSIVERCVKMVGNA
jgi:2-oxoisovalerate dehydrogenase E1 component